MPDNSRRLDAVSLLVVGRSLRSIDTSGETVVDYGNSDTAWSTGVELADMLDIPCETRCDGYSMSYDPSTGSVSRHEAR